MDIKYLQKLNEDKRLQDLEYITCKNDPYYWMTNWAYTQDTHDPENAIKPFPQKEYIDILVKLWLKEKLLLVPKSRQMLISWIFTALYLWDTQFHENRLTFFQSKKEDDANELVKRSRFIWDREPKFLKRYYEDGQYKELICNPHNHGEHVYCLMDFPQINSKIKGIPEGGDIIRMYTSTGILSDEMAFQPAAKEAYTAAKPTISGYGRFTGVSTPEDGTFFEKLIYDKLEI